jgi:hypothetical protein
VLPNTRQLPGLSSNTLIPRADLKESVTSVSDLKDKKIPDDACCFGQWPRTAHSCTPD